MFESQLAALIQLVPATLLGLIGWGCASRLRLPAATILGPMILVAAASLFDVLDVTIPAWMNFLLQVVIASFLGYSIDRNAAVAIRSMAGTIVVVTVCMILSAITIGYLLALITGIDAATAFLGTSPGGLTEMSAMALSSNANVALVATLQSLRLVTTLVVIPFIAKSAMVPSFAITSPQYMSMSCNHTADRPGREANVLKSEIPVVCRSDDESLPWPLWFLGGTLGGLLFAWLHVPAAGVLGAMLAVGAMRIQGANIRRPPSVVRTCAQIYMGIAIGVAFNEQSLWQLRNESALLLLVTAATIANGLVLAGVLHRLLDIDLRTCLLACAPGGFVQMGIIAEELGGRTFVVNAFQLARLVCSVVIVPLLFPLFV